MSTPSSFLCLFWFFCVFVASVVGENTPHLFQWAFNGTALPLTIPTCTTLPLFVESIDPTTNVTNGVPPYYMISFPIGGTPQTSFIGSDETNLMWTVTQPAGSQLLLSVVDSQQNPGGIPGQLVTVISGQTTQCVTTPINTPAFTVSANVSGNIEPCAPWGITVVGGSPPYTITLVETNDPIVTNVSMNFGTDRFTFINRANPNGKLIAAISDLEGRWATGTPVVNPIGSANNCTGLVSSSGDNAAVNEQDAQINAAATAATKKHTAIIAVVVVIILLLLIGIGGAVFWNIRKRKQQAQTEEKAALPTQFLLSDRAEPVSSTASPGRWQTRSDEKSAMRRDVEAPPYQEMRDLTARPVASGSRSELRPPRAGIEPLPTAVGTAPLLRSQLPRLKMPLGPLPDLDNQATSQTQSADSTTDLIPSIVGTNGSLGQSPESSKKPLSEAGRARTSRFTNFPTKPIRKSSGVALDIALPVSKAPNRSAFPRGQSKSATGRSVVAGSGTDRSTGPIPEGDGAQRGSEQYYQDSVDFSLEESGLPRYRSLRR